MAMVDVNRDQTYFNVFLKDSRTFDTDMMFMILPKVKQCSYRILEMVFDMI